MKKLTVDMENGCSECWEKVWSMKLGLGCETVLEVTDRQYKTLKAKVGKCNHDAPLFASSIFLEFQK
jgi:hypothetical protein